jgi:transposase
MSITEYCSREVSCEGIENFWSFAKRRMAKFNDCASDKFVMPLKECEWRYNHRDKDLFPAIKKLSKKYSFAR